MYCLVALCVLRLAGAGEVVVDGEPLQVVSVITTTTTQLPDGSQRTQYHFSDRVSEQVPRVSPHSTDTPFSHVHSLW